MHLTALPSGLAPHALQRTSISLMLEAGASVPYVMAQVGHATPAVTLQIYAQVLNRSRRHVGEQFDQLMRDAIPAAEPPSPPSHERPAGPQRAEDLAPFGPEFRPQAE